MSIYINSTLVKCWDDDWIIKSIVLIIFCTSCMKILNPIAILIFEQCKFVWPNEYIFDNIHQSMITNDLLETLYNRSYSLKSYYNQSLNCYFSNEYENLFGCHVIIRSTMAPKEIYIL